MYLLCFYIGVLEYLLICKNRQHSHAVAFYRVAFFVEFVWSHMCGFSGYFSFLLWFKGQLATLNCL